MTPDVVADVGNSRIKWGRCSPDAVVEAASLPPEDETAWRQQAARWGLPCPAAWVIAGVHPAWRERLAEWARRRSGDTVIVLTDYRQLPLVVQVPRPEGVGIDRLLDAVAVNGLRAPGRPAIVIDAGSAVTVDWIDESGAFAGGAILPGFDLMSRALHEHTALLPRIEVPRRPPEVPGTATAAAMEAGVYWAVAGGVRSIVAAYRQRCGTETEVFLTGGDAAAIQAAPGFIGKLYPMLTLEGARLAVAAPARSDS